MSLILMLNVILIFIAIVASYLLLVVGMADDTLLTAANRDAYGGFIRAGTWDIFHKSNPVATRKVNGTTHKVGLGVTQTGETYNDTALYDRGDELFGIIYSPIKQPADTAVETAWTLDDALDDNSEIEIIRKEDWQGAIFLLPIEPPGSGAVTGEEGTEIVASNAGKFALGRNGLYGRQKIAEWYVDGNILIATGLAKHIARADGNIVEVVMTAAVDGDDGSVLADVNINGTTIFTTQGNRPEITSTDGNNFVESATTIEAGEFEHDDIITIDIDDDGGTTPATDVKVEVYADFGTLVGYLNEEKAFHATEDRYAEVKMA